MKAQQEGEFNIPMCLDNVCNWTTYVFAVGSDIWQIDDNNHGDSGEVTSTFQHAWKDLAWDWSFSCGASKSGPSCGVSASPSNSATAGAWSSFCRPCKTFQY